MCLSHSLDYFFVISRYMCRNVSVTFNIPHTLSLSLDLKIRKSLIYPHLYVFLGIGFAIPIDTVKAVVDIIIRDGKVTRPSTGILFYTGQNQAKSLVSKLLFGDIVAISS